MNHGRTACRAAFIACCVFSPAAAFAESTAVKTATELVNLIATFTPDTAEQQFRAAREYLVGDIVAD